MSRSIDELRVEDHEGRCLAVGETMFVKADDLTASAALTAGIPSSAVPTFMLGTQVVNLSMLVSGLQAGRAPRSAQAHCRAIEDAWTLVLTVQFSQAAPAPAAAPPPAPAPAPGPAAAPASQGPQDDENPPKRARKSDILSPIRSNIKNALNSFAPTCEVASIAMTGMHAENEGKRGGLLSSLLLDISNKGASCLIRPCATPQPLHPKTLLGSLD